MAGDLVVAVAANETSIRERYVASRSIWDLCTYTGETTYDLMENADYTAHLYNAGTSQLNWDWTMTSTSSNTVSSSAIAIKAGSAQNYYPSVKLRKRFFLNR